MYATQRFVWTQSPDIFGRWGQWFGTPLKERTKSVPSSLYTSSIYYKEVMTMIDAFYIVETSPNWYQLRLCESHICLSAGRDFQKRLDIVKKYVKKFKTAERLAMFVDHLREENPDSPVYITHNRDGKEIINNTVRQRRSEYDEVGRAFDDIIKETVKEALQELRDDNPVKKNKMRIKTAIQKDDPPPVTLTPGRFFKKVVESTPEPPAPIHNKVSPVKIHRTLI
jgi:dTDP-4-dehydrorhamnose reductase